MLHPRVIPILLLKDKGLYKGSKFKKHKYVGDPINTIKIFNEKEVDEIIILDIGSKIAPDFNYLKSITKEAFMPMCYGGNIQSLDDAKKIFSSGFEKISINSLFFNNLDVVKELIETFGSQSIVLSLDLKKNIFGNYYIYRSKGKKKVKISVVKVLEQASEIGIGEILMTSINNDGIMEGYDLTLIDKYKHLIDVPFIINGGAGNFEHICLAKKEGADAMACGSMFVFQGIHKAVLITYKSFYNQDVNCE